MDKLKDAKSRPRKKTAVKRPAAKSRTKKATTIKSAAPKNAKTKSAAAGALAVKALPGRPTKYTPELGDQICAAIAKGDSFRSITAREDMPAISTLFAWRRLHAEFDKNYFIAKEQCADLYAEDIIEISDDCSNDWMEKQNENGECIGWQVNKECVARSRLRVDSRKWIAAKLKPGRYGEKTTQEITGGEGGPLQLVMKVVYE